MSDAGNPPPSGSLCHVEIPAPDLKAAAEFYRAIFGWEMVPMGERYLLFRDGVAGGGLDADATPCDDRGCVLVYAVDDIDAMLGRIGELGGATIKGKTEIGGDHGFYAYFRDPNGNRMGLWSKT